MEFGWGGFVIRGNGIMSLLGEQVLRKLSRDPKADDFVNEGYEEKHKNLQPAIDQFTKLFPNFKTDISGNKVLDIGCAEGIETIAIASLGAGEVIGIDIRTDEEKFAKLASELAPSAKVSIRLNDAEQTSFPDDFFDSVITLGSFEHFNDPKAILKEANRILKPGGKIYATSGVWNHPYGAHMNFFTKVPWVHFIFSEETIMNVRKLYRSDGAKKYHEIDGGLNDIGISKFKRYAEETGFTIEYLRLNPVKGLTFLTRIPHVNEYFSNLIIGILRKNIHQTSRSW
jgi:ubiquinone/menaquinone biosynthesis C-methylase UbiE